MSSIKPKTGNCLDCPDGIIKPLIAKRCQHHYWLYRESLSEKKEQKPKAKIKNVSDKRKVENREYTIKRLQFLAQPGNQKCFIEGCKNKADSIEHRAGRWGDNYLDTTTWAPCCNFHNLELERNPELSQKYQLSKISGKEKIQKQPLKKLSQ